MADDVVHVSTAPKREGWKKKKKRYRFFSMTFEIRSRSSQEKFEEASRIGVVVQWWVGGRDD
jgi:hypothetical protein